MRRALLLGATGLVGERCLAHLLKRDEYTHVTCLVRRAGSVSAHGEHAHGERLEERVVDFDKLSSVDAVDDVYCAIGSTIKKAGSQEAFRHVDYDIPLNVAKLAVDGGAKRFALVSSVGADPSSSTFYLKTKGELEDALAALFTDQSKTGKALHVFRPSFLVGDRKESRPGERVGIGIARATSGLLFGGLRKYRPIHVDTVALAMIAAMLGPDPNSPRKTYDHDGIEALAKG